MDLFELVGRLSIEGTDKAERELDSLTGKAEKTGSKFGSIVSGIGKGALAITGAVAGGTAVLVKSVSGAWGELQQSIGGIETLFGESAPKVIENANKAFQTAGISANEYMQQATSFSASLLQSLAGDTEKACEYTNMAIIDMSDNANKMGSSMESIQNAYQGFAKQNYTMLDNLKLGYGGTKGEMERLLADASAIAGIQFDISSYADVVEAIHVIQTEMGIAGTTSLEAGETITGSMGSLSASWQNFIAGLGNPDADMKVLVQNLANSISGMVTNVTPVIENMASVLPTVLEAIINSVGTMMPSLVDTFTNLVLTVISALITNLPTFLNGIAQLLMGLATGIGAMLPTIFGELGGLLEVGYQILETIINGFAEGVPNALPRMLEFIQQFADTCAEKAPEFITKGFELLSKLIEGIMSALPILIENVPRIISTFARIITDNVPRILLLGVGLILDLVKGLISAIPTLIANIPQICKAIFDVVMAFQWLNLGKNIINFFTNGIKNMIPAVKQVGKNVSDGIVDTIKALPSHLMNLGKSAMYNLGNTISGLQSFIRTCALRIFSAIETTFLRLPSQLKQAGRDMITGLWNGIVGMAGWVKNKISGFCKGLVDKFKSSFAIKSPSRIMKDEVGRMLAEGVAVGIDEGSEIAESSAEKMSQKVLDASQKRLDDYKVYNELTLADEVAFWDEVRKKCEDGTDAKLSADKKYFEAKKSLDDEILKAENTLQDSLDAIQKKIDDRAKSILSSFNLFQEFSVDKENVPTRSELIDNLSTQVDALEERGEVLESLRDKIGDTELFDELQSLGVENLAQLEQLNKMTERQLEKYAELYQKRSDLARNLATNELAGETESETADAYGTYNETMSGLGVEEYNNNLVSSSNSAFTEFTTSVTTATQTIIATVDKNVKDTIKIANTLPPAIKEVGKFMIEGLYEGMVAKSTWLNEQVDKYIEKLKQRIRASLGIASPSKVMAEIGGFISQGLGVGILSDTSAEDSIGEKAKNIIDIANDTLGNAKLVDDLFVESPMQKYQLDFNAQIGSLNDGFERLIALVGNYLPDIAGGMDRNIVLDGNSLAVGMSRRIDVELGKMAVAKGRGNV